MNNIERFLQKLGPTNFILVFLFPVLCLYEFLDGTLDVGDYGVLLLFALFINDIYFGKLGNNENQGSRTLFSPYKKLEKMRPLDVPYSRRTLFFSNKMIKLFMNVIFTILISVPIFMSGPKMMELSKWGFFKNSVVVWSMVFLALSFYDFRNNKNEKRRVFVNAALVIFVASVIFY